MKKKCPNCNLVNFADAGNCLRCGAALAPIEGFAEDGRPRSIFRSKPFKRAAGCVSVLVAAILTFYMSLVLTADPLDYEQKRAVERAILALQAKGFAKDVFLLRYPTVYRANDNWLNASTRLENAYAATNFPFELMTVYPDFFTFPNDDLERAAILLHEAQHLKGADEKEAYRFVWEHREQLGWTEERYGNSIVWRNVRKQTREVAPELFSCPEKNYGDCTLP
jgi:hypothetical protein